MKTRFIIIGLFTLLIGSFIMGLFDIDPYTGITVASTAFATVIGGLKSSKDLKEEKGKIWERAQAMIASAKDEKRSLTEDELKDYDGLLEDMRGLDLEIKRAEEHEKRMLEMANTHINKENKRQEDKELKQFSFLRFIRGAMKNKVEGFELEMHQEAQREAKAAGVEISGYGIPSFVPGVAKRDMSATGGSSGSEGGVMVQTDVEGFIDALSAKMVLKDLGATFLTGLVGNVDIPRISTATTAAWEGENEANTETQPTFDKVQLTPNRLGAYAQISKQLIAQTSYSAENIARNDIERAIRLAVELAAINGAGTGNVPKGILNQTGIGSVAGGTNGAAPDWADIVNLEKEVAVDNADIGALAYLTNPKVRAKLKNTAIGTDMRMVWGADNMLNGYKTGITTQVPSDLDKGSSTGVCSAIIFGNFSDLLIAQWAGLDVVVDPYTSAKNAMVDLVINSWWDADVRHAASFAAMVDATTT